MEKVFSSWTEIATYLGKGVRTVQRWELELNLPVHRDSSSRVVALQSELDEWARRAHREHTSPRLPVIQRSHELRERAQQNVKAVRATWAKTAELWDEITRNRSLSDRPSPQRG